MRLTRAVEPDTPLTWADVTVDEDDAATAGGAHAARDGGGVRAGSVGLPQAATSA